MRRSQKMCKKIIMRKMPMCALAPELSMRREKNKNCYFAKSNESLCSAANTGERGACAKINEEKGLICMGTSFNSLNKCRAVCEVSLPLNKPVCGQPSDCTGKTKKWYCVEKPITIPTETWGECPITKNNECDATCNPNYGKICCSTSGGAISRDGYTSNSKSCLSLEDAEKATDGKGQGLKKDAEGNLVCTFFAP